MATIELTSPLGDNFVVVKRPMQDKRTIKYIKYILCNRKEYDGVSVDFRYI